MADDISFFEAYEQALDPLFTAGKQLQIVARAEACGLLRALRTESTADELGARTGVPHRSVLTLCRALVACSVAEAVDGGRFRLTPAWLALTGPTAYAPLDVVLAGNDVESRLLRGSDDDTFWSMSVTDRVTYARAVSPDPYSDGLVAAFRKQIAGDGERAAMTSGGRLLELGCGVAGRVLTTLRAMPALSAVGVELSPDLAAEAHRRAQDLGLTDRFEVVCADASQYRSDEPFDFGFWSQFFFPAPAREGALRAMHACLRPGGVLDAPLGADFAAIDADPGGTAARDFAIWRVILDSWDVPERRPDDLVSEFTAAGFVEVRVVERDAGPIVRGRRP